MRFLDSYNNLTRSEVGILLFLLLSTYRICLLPAILSEAAGESAFYVVLAGLGIDVVVCFAALLVASKGGVEALSMPRPVKRALGGVFAVYFLFKTLVRTYEVVHYCVGDLFEQAMPMLLVVVFVITAGLVASKGFAGIARTGIMILLITVFLVGFAAFYAGFCGYGYNLWVLLRPHDVGKGLLYSSLWLGDGAVLAFADTRTTVKPRSQFAWGAMAVAVVLVGMCFFYLNFIYTYGSAGRYVQYAFVRMLTNGDPEELGAVDWPIMLIWLMSVPLHLASQFYAGSEGVRLLLSRREHGGFIYLAGFAVAVVVAYYFLFADKDGFAALYRTDALSYVLLGLLGVVVLLGAVALRRRPKEQANER